MRIWKSRFYFLIGLLFMAAGITQAYYLAYLPNWVLRLRWWRHPTDRILHCAVYGLCTWLFMQVVLQQTLPGSGQRKRLLVIAALSVLTICTVDEYFQRYQVPLRSSDWGDAFANVAGTACALLAFWLGDRIRRRKVRRDELPPRAWTVRAATVFLARIHRHRILEHFRLPAEIEARTGLCQALAPLSTPDLTRVLKWSGQPELTIQALSAVLPPDDPRLPEIKSACRTPILALQQQDLRRETAIAELLHSLAAANVPASPFKGAYLAARLGLPPGCRPENDIDLLIPNDQLDAALAALAPLGCTLATDDPAGVDYLKNLAHDCQLRHPTLGLIELHSRTYAEIPLQAQTDLWRRATPATWLGAPIQQLETNDWYLLLCLHLFRQGWTAGPKWVVDLLHFETLLETLHPGQSFPHHGPAIGLNGLSWDVLKSRCIDWEIAFPVLAVQACLRHLQGRPNAIPADEGLQSLLNPAETEALAWIKSSDGLEFTAEWMVYQARCARRKANGRTGLIATLWPHPGRIAVETGVRSDTPGFWWVRLRWLCRRMIRALAAAANTKWFARAVPEQELPTLPELDIPPMLPLNC